MSLLNHAIAQPLVRKPSSCTITPTTHASMVIYVKISFLEAIFADIKPSETIQLLKEKIAVKKPGMDRDYIILFNSKHLQDLCTLHSYGIVNSTLPTSGWMTPWRCKGEKNRNLLPLWYTPNIQKCGRSKMKEHWINKQIIENASWSPL